MKIAMDRIGIQTKSKRFWGIIVIIGLVMNSLFVLEIVSGAEE
jgi:hypothetical protein